MMIEDFRIISSPLRINALDSASAARYVTFRRQSQASQCEPPDGIITLRIHLSCVRFSCIGEESQHPPDESMESVNDQVNPDGTERGCL